MTPTPAEVADGVELRADPSKLFPGSNGAQQSALALAGYVLKHRALIVTALRALSAEPSAFLATTRHFQLPAPQLNIGGEPCGECHIQPGETCDICGARNPPAALSAEPSEAEVERAAEAAFLTSQRRTQAPRDRFPWASIDIAMQSYWRDIARAALRSRRAEGGQ